MKGISVFVEKIKNKPDRLWLGLILLVALGLRLYQLDSLSLGNDELSALHRLSYDSFSGLIEHGVMPDGHPAGIQVFLYFYTRLLGTAPWVLRLPFLVASLFSIGGIFILGKRWFGAPTGLLAALSLATWEYSLMHSLSIRPYSMGMALGLAMVICWDQIRVRQKPTRIYWIGYVLCATACFYIHYFSMLLALLLAGASLVYLKPPKWKPFLTAWAFILALYLPHLGIFLAQLHTGGIGGWLAAPKPDFLLGYVQFLLHFSPIQYAAMGLWVLGGLGWAIRSKKWPNSVPLAICLFLFGGTYVIGHGYSLWVNPLLHFGVLFFAFPYLLLAVFAWVPPLPTGSLLLFLTFTSIFSLINNRDHYGLFYHRGSLEIARDVSSWRTQVGAHNLASWGIAYHRDYLDFYLQRQVEPFSLSLYDSPSYLDFEQWIAHRQEPYFAWAWLNKRPPLAYLAIIEKYYPYRMESHKRAISEWYLFAKAPEQLPPPPGFSYKWDSLSYPLITIDSTQEFGPSLFLKYPQDFRHPYDWIKLRAEIGLPDSFSSLPQLVLSVENEKGVLFWKGVSFAEFAPSHSDIRQSYVYLRMRDLPAHALESATWKAYVWNPGKAHFTLTRMHLELEEGNPELYGLVAPVDRQ